MTFKKHAVSTIKKIEAIPSKLNTVDKMAIAGIMLLVLAVANNGGF